MCTRNTHRPLPRHLDASSGPRGLDIMDIVVVCNLTNVGVESFFLLPLILINAVFVATRNPPRFATKLLPLSRKPRSAARVYNVQFGGHLFFPWRPNTASFLHDLSIFRQKYDYVLSSYGIIYCP